MKIICVPHAPETHSSEVVFYILNKFVHELKSRGMEFSTCGITLLRIFGLGVLVQGGITCGPFAKSTVRKPQTLRARFL